MHKIGVDQEVVVCLVGQARDKAVSPIKWPYIEEKAKMSTLLQKCDHIAGYFQGIANGVENHIMFTWCVLSSFYLFEQSRLDLAKFTPKTLWQDYFMGGSLCKSFEDRFELYLSGVVQFDKLKKQTIVVIQAKTPYEIVLAEWLLCKRLETR